ncbi:MAG: TonB-dependent receptor [Thalassotalea sp.]
MKLNNKNFKLNSLLSCMLISGAMSSITYAADETTKQAKAEKEVEVIQVVASSYANSLAIALSAKRQSSGVVDSILAEDIADFPDQNLADSLQRIPGVAVDRAAGEGRTITVRGLNSTFTRVQLNGMPSQSLSAGDGGVNTSRGFDFNIFASELFNSLEVHKTTSAELDEGSLGATVALRTARPFDYNENVAAFNFQEGYNDQSGDMTPRASGVLSFKNDDDSLGALFSLAYAERSISNKGVNSGRWEDDKFGDCTACDGDTAQERGDSVGSLWHPRFPRMADKTHEQERLGLTASLQWTATDSTLITFDALYANVQSERNEPFMQAISLARTGDTGIKQSNITALQVDSNDTMIAATIDEVDVRSEYFIANWESEFTQFSLNVEQDITDNFSASLLVGSSKSVLDNTESTVAYEHFSSNDSRKNINYANNTSSVSYDYSNKLNPDISYGFDTANPANWEMSEFRNRIYDGESTSNTAKVDFLYNLTDDVTISFGINSKDYGYELAGSRADKLFDSLKGDDGTACGISPTVTDTNGAVVNRGGQSFFMANNAEINRMLSSGCWPQAVRAGDTRSVDEEALGYYVQTDFYFELGNMELRGNAGVRKVDTDVSSTGIINDSEVTVKNDYSDTLPSINLALDVTEDVVLRTSWSKVMSRPNLTDLNPGGSVSIFGDAAVNYGNPFIEPFRADAFDLSAEWYFAEGALLSVAYFEKDIESFPTTQTDTILWAETGLPDSLLGAQVNDLRNAEFEVSRKINGLGGNLDGVEIQYQQTLDFLPGPDWVRKFGVLANMTFVNSEVQYSEERSGPLTGQSDESSNFTLYWEDDAFSARISMANRGEYFTRVDSNPKKSRMVDDATYIDLSTSYQVTENLKLKFEVLNLTNETTVQTMDTEVHRIIDSVETGTTYSVGFSYKM